MNGNRSQSIQVGGRASQHGQSPKLHKTGRGGVFGPQISGYAVHTR